MRVAVAGTGSFAKHFIDEVPGAEHEVVVLTSSHKGFLGGKKGVVAQRTTDYSFVPQLVELLSDCDALVSIIFDITQPNGEAHLALLEACKQTPKCKRFIPSEYGGNSEDFPENAESMDQHNVPLRASANRNHPNAGPLHPLDLHARTMEIPGTGNDVFSTTSARDVTKAIAELLKSEHKWHPYTYVQGMETTWLQLAELVKTVSEVSDLKVSLEPVNEIKEALEKKESSQSALLAEFKMLVPSGKCTFDQAKVQRDRAEHFPNVHLRTAKELLETVKQNQEVTV